MKHDQKKYFWVQYTLLLEESIFSPCFNPVLYVRLRLAESCHCRENGIASPIHSTPAAAMPVDNSAITEIFFWCRSNGSTNTLILKTNMKETAVGYAPLWWHIRHPHREIVRIEKRSAEPLMPGPYHRFYYLGKVWIIEVISSHFLSSMKRL